MSETPRGNGLPQGFAAEEAGGELDLSRYVDILRRRWKLVALIGLLGLLGGIIHYFITPKRYMASTTIQIERRSLNPLGGGMSNAWLEGWWNMEYYPTQYALLKSRGLAERVVQDLRLYEDPAFSSSWASRPEGEASPELDAVALGRMGLRLQGDLTIRPVKETQLVEIAYRSGTAELAARVANGVAESFIDWALETRSTAVGRTSTFLSEQIAALKEEIQEKEAQLQASSFSGDVATLDPQTNVLVSRLEAINQDYIQAVSQRIDKEVRWKELRDLPEEQLAETLSDPTVVDLRGKQLSMEDEYARNLSIFKPDWPAMVELKARIDQGRAHLADAVTVAVGTARRSAESEYQTALRRQQALANELQRVKKENMSLSSAAVEYESLRVEISTRRELYDLLLQRQSETDVAARMQGSRDSNIRVVDRALVPRGPFTPILRKDAGMALGLGLGLGVLMVLLLEFLDRTVKGGEEAEKIMAAPVLAVISDLGAEYKKHGYGYGYGYGSSKRRDKRDERAAKKTRPQEALAIELLPHDKPRHVVSEAYRSLRTALLLSTADELKVVSVTSAQSGEGKTSTVANLAVVLAQLGKKVLVVDGDLRKPRMHEVFGVPNRVGLVGCLTGQGELAEAIQSTSITGLSLLPSGPIPPNPSELLASDRMKELLSVLRKRLDMVLVDTPPVLAVSDAVVLGDLVDGVVVCLRAGSVLREEASACAERLRQGQARLLGSVLNRFIHSGAGDSRRHYYYSHYYSKYDSDSSSAA